MNAKYRAKDRKRLAGALALMAWLAPLCAMADDGNLTQQLHIQQQKSRFQLKLEQVQKKARRRAASRHTARAQRTVAARSTDLGDPSQPIRLHSLSVTDPLSPRIESEDAGRSRARQTVERDQQRMLDHRQQRRALTAGARTIGTIGNDRFAAKRNALVRFDAQIQRQTLQRKLRH